MNNKERNELQKEILDNVGINQSGRLILAPRIGN